MFRATWISQEVINTFSNDIKSVSLVPSDGGKFEIWLDDKLIFSRHKENEFIDIKLIKQRLRDEIDPLRSLGHSDK